MEHTQNEVSRGTRSLNTYSRASVSSTSSKANLAVARAKAEAAESQWELVEQACIKATLETLQVEKERDAAFAEAKKCWKLA